MQLVIGAVIVGVCAVIVGVETFIYQPAWPVVALGLLGFVFGSMTIQDARTPRDGS